MDCQVILNQKGQVVATSQHFRLVGTIQEKPIFYWVFLYVTSSLTSAFYLIVPKYDTSAGNIKEPQKISRIYRWIPR